MILTSLDDVQPGMVLGVGLRNREGQTLLGPGQPLTAEYIGRLRGLGYCAVWIDDEDTRDIPYEDNLSDSTRLAAMTAVRDTFVLTSRETEKLRSASVQEVRGTLESRRFQQAFQDHAVVERITGQVDAVVSEVLNRAVLTGLSSMRTHSSYTYHHCLDVAVTATMIGRILGYDKETLKKLAVGCILHDIGTIFVDTELLDKDNALTPEEFARVKDHTVLGYLFLRDTFRLGVLTPHIAYQHHERQDGSGYPRGLVGTNRIVTGAEIHLPGRITPLAEIAAIADVHDACSSDRPFRKRFPPDRVWQMLRDSAGRHLNREIVEGFLSVLPPYPLGTQVQVLDGTYRDYIGVVAHVDQKAMDWPVVRLLHDPSGERIAPVELDLRKEEVRIRGIVDSTTRAVASS